MSAPFALIPYVPALFVWLTSSWYAFYRALKLALPGRSALLLALASPAVLINAVGGQNGCWTAALLGGGLGLLEKRPYIAGALFGGMIYKPQLAVAGAGRAACRAAMARHRRCRADGGRAARSELARVRTGIVGALSAQPYGACASFILEDGTGVWHRFVSVFVAARQLGASVEAAYVIQAATAAMACIAIAWIWFRDTPAAVKNAVLLLGTCLATPYLQDYDMVFGAIVVAWLWQQPVESERAERILQIACGLLLHAAAGGGGAGASDRARLRPAVRAAGIRAGAAHEFRRARRGAILRWRFRRRPRSADLTLL